MMHPMLARDLSPRAQRLWMVAILALLAAYHLATIQRQCLFIDEAAELQLSQQTIGQIVWAADSMPPLYALSLKAWTSVFGAGASARWLSALYHAATVVAAWLLLRRLAGPRLAVVTAAVVAFTPLLLFYAQLIRGYAMFTMLAVCAMGLLAVAARWNRVLDWALFVAAGVLGMFCHYYFALLLATLALLALATPKAARVRAVAAFLAIGLLASPTVLLVGSDLRFQKGIRESRPLNASAAAYTYFSMLSGYTLGPSRAQLHALGARAAAADAAPWALGLAAAVAPLGWLGVVGLRRHRLAVGTLALLFVPVLLAGALGWASGVTYNTRFVAWCAAPLGLLLAAGMVEGLSRRGVLKWAAVAATALLTLLCCVAIYNRAESPRYANEDLRSAVAAIESAELGPTDNADPSPVLVVSGYMSEVAALYLAQPGRAIPLPRPETAEPVVADARQAEAAAQQAVKLTQEHGGWLIYTRPFHGDPDGLLLDAMRARLDLVEQTPCAGVRVFRVTPRRDY
ncbi:hypothetical protein Pla175_34100 [Pirellulimonas nuda]|uniref:Glycosyltransferase RgtA/B/C/D-like domain-containing protein n=1 Tax=Pirellulimonas nuda TaxID=2528009 RepID=A0A518DEV5_9BACT|nr:glycosyltransferase family 39 protein [Pirellulimonas nuda]QDU90011.1 hypothetical protein Pla175_34100 [Pirellulimonas nuda]